MYDTTMIIETTFQNMVLVFAPDRKSWALKLLALKLWGLEL